MIPIAKPLIGLEEINSVTEVLKSGTIAEGPKVKEFEEAFAKYIGTNYAIAVNSGTAALHVALLAKGIGKGDEVITTPFTFIATANSVLYTGAKPVFVDADAETFNIDAGMIEDKITKDTKAIIPVDLYGQPAEMKAIMEIAKDHGLSVIEDACQAHGATYNGKAVGSFDVGCFSFYPTKNMTTGEGGIITSDDKEFAEKAGMIKSHGSKVRYHHEMLGFNLRMTDIGAAIGLVQLQKIDEYNRKRIENAAYLNKRLAGIKGIVIPAVKPGCKHVFHQYTIRVTKEYGMSRDDLVKKLTAAGIGTGIYYPIPIHMQPFYLAMGFNESYPVSEQLSKEVISLPVHPSVTTKDIDYIANTLRGI
jgi:dTDP-4-amino-4,6-dideoxygalactose transaminase